MLQGRPRRLSHVGAASLRGSLASVDQSHHVIYGQNLWSKGSATARRPRQRAGSRDRGRQSAGRSQTKMYYSGRVSANRTDQELSASAPIFLALKAIRTYIFEHLGILIIRPAVQNLVRGVDLKPNCPLSDAPYIVLSHDNGSIKVRRACDSNRTAAEFQAHWVRQRSPRKRSQAYRLRDGLSVSIHPHCLASNWNTRVSHSNRKRFGKRDDRLRVRRARPRTLHKIFGIEATGWLAGIHKLYRQHPQG
jgi:hypothetical protein